MEKNLRKTEENFFLNDESLLEVLESRYVKNIGVLKKT